MAEALELLGANEDVGAVEAVAPETERAPAESGRFFDSLEDVGLRDWAANKGFPGLAEAMESHRNLEKLLGSEKLPMPRDDNDREGLERVYKALGKPDDPKAYGLDRLEGVDPGFAGEAGGWFQEAGLNPRQAGVLAERWQAFVTGREAVEQQRAQVKSAQDISALQGEWGGAFDANVELARRAARQFGVGEALPALEQALGSRGLIAFLHRVGSGLGEDSYETGAPARGFSLSPDQARARIDALKRDTGFGARYLARDAEATAEMDRLHRIAFG
jgi:hypothetical protein